MHSLTTHFILGYHGCLKEQGEAILLGENFKISENSYDWLGSGVYFWESDPERAYLWALEKCKRLKISLDNAFIVGAVIDLGFCLDMTTIMGIEEYKNNYEALSEIFEKTKLPVNSGGEDKLLRKLDCLIFNFIHQRRSAENQNPFDAVRGIFMEGGKAFEGSGFFNKTHTQICVRNLNLIKGTFRVNLNGMDDYLKKKFSEGIYL